jgi:hypothetical protein
MLQKLLIKIPAWASLFFIAYATLLISSSVEHLAAFAVFGALFCLAYLQRIPAVLIFVVGSAALPEVLSCLLRIAHARILDAFQKIVGAVLGVFAGRAILHLERARLGSKYNLSTTRVVRCRGLA